MVLPLLAMGAGLGSQIGSALYSGSSSRKAATEFAQQQAALMRRQQEANRAAQARIAEEQAKQADIRKRIQASTESAIEGNSAATQTQQIDDFTNKRIKGFKTLSDLLPVNIDLGGSRNAPSIVADAIKGSVGRATTKGQQQAAAKAAIEALGDVGVRNQIGTARFADELGTSRRLNNISNVLAGNERDFMNNLAQLTSSQISLAGQGANQRLGVKKAKAANLKTIGDLLFMAGSMGMGGGGGGTVNTGNFGGGGGGPVGGFSPNTVML